MEQEVYNPQRTIATIMAADIVGYSKLMGEDEVTTLSALKLRRAAFEYFVSEFGGRTFGTVGDSFMAEFPSVLNGVKSALNLHAAIQKLNETLPENKRMRMRIALNLGDVIRQGNDLFGDGVNIAARLEPLADPDGICIAGNVYEQIHRKLNLHYHFLGAQQFKNIDAPVKAFKILGYAKPEPYFWQDLLNTLKINQGFRYQLLLILLLGLVLANFVPTMVKEVWLSLAGQAGIISASLLIAFSQFKKIQSAVSTDHPQSLIDPEFIEQGIATVKSKFLHIPVDIREITRSQNILPSIAVLRFSDMSPEHDQAYFSDGLAEELVNVLSKSNKLSVSSRSSSFAFQPGEIDAEDFAKKLGVDYFIEGSVRKLLNRVRITAQLIKVSSNSHLWSETYDRVLDDIFEIQDDISNKIAQALQIKIMPELDKNSLTSDPRAYDFYLRGRAFFGYKGVDNIQYALQMFTLATNIDPNFIRAWTYLAETLAIHSIFYNGGESSKLKAKEIAGKILLLAPDRGDTYVALGMAHLAGQEYSLATSRLEKAIMLDPKSYEAHHNLARTYYHQGKFEQAIRYFEKSAKLDPADFDSYPLCAPLYMALGDEQGAQVAYSRALERIQRYLDYYPDNQRAYQLGAICLLRLGEQSKAHQWAEQALSLAPEDPATLYNLACFYAQAGDKDKAFDCLANSISSRSWIEQDPELAPLRTDPRYQEILNKLSE
jgi:adenylate cyclase